MIHSGEHKTSSPAVHRSAETFNRQLLRSVKLTNQYCTADNATFMLLLDEQRGGSAWRESNVEACTLAMFSDNSEQCRRLIEPPIQGESHLFQMLRNARTGFAA